MKYTMTIVTERVLEAPSLKVAQEGARLLTPESTGFRILDVRPVGEDFLCHWGAGHTYHARPDDEEA